MLREREWAGIMWHDVGTARFSFHPRTPTPSCSNIHIIWPYTERRLGRLLVDRIWSNRKLGR